MAGAKLASEGQQNYIAALFRTRAGNPQTMEEIAGADKPEGMVCAPGSLSVAAWIEVLTFAMATEALRWLVKLPEPPPVEEREITPGQRSKCWAILKNLGCNTYKAWLLKKDDPDIPNLRWDDANTTVWDWLSGLSMTEASEVIEHLEAVQQIVRR